MSTASMARRASRVRSSDMISAIVGVDRRQLLQLRAVPAEPDDLDVGEGAGLVEVDEALLEQLEHGQEADDDVEPLDQASGELPEPDATGQGELLHELEHRLGH